MNDVKPSNKYYDIDLRETLSSNRLVGLWRMLKGYYTAYFGANLSLAAGALAKTGTFLLLAYFIDNVLGQESELNALLLIGAAFVRLAAVEGGFTYLSGRLAAFTAEGITRRAAQLPVRSHPAPVLSLPRQDPDRRADRALDLGCGCRAPLLCRTGDRRGAHHPAVPDQLHRHLPPERQPGADLDHRRAGHPGHLDLLLQAS